MDTITKVRIGRDYLYNLDVTFRAGQEFVLDYKNDWKAGRDGEIGLGVIAAIAPYADLKYIKILNPLPIEEKIIENDALTYNPSTEAQKVTQTFLKLRTKSILKNTAALIDNKIFPYHATLIISFILIMGISIWGIPEHVHPYPTPHPIHTAQQDQEVIDLFVASAIAEEMDHTLNGRVK